MYDWKNKFRKYSSTKVTLLQSNIWFIRIIIVMDGKESAMARWPCHTKQQRGGVTYRTVDVRVEVTEAEQHR